MAELVFDIETDGLLDELSTIHCINLKDRLSGSVERYNDHPGINPSKRTGSLQEGLERLSEADALVGHNIQGFDILALQKIYPDFKPKGKIKDTLVYSRVIWTDIKHSDFQALKRGRRDAEFQRRGLIGRHSLEAWGFRFGNYKGDYGPMMEAKAQELGITDPEEITKFVWGSFNAEMDDYCVQDVAVTSQLIDAIEAKGYSEDSLELEARVAAIIGMQERHGVLYDVEGAEKLHVELIAEMADLEDQLRAAFPPWFTPKRKYGEIEVMSPKRSMTRREDLEGNGHKVPVRYEAGAPYCKIELRSFNPKSRDHIAERMITLFGWEPQEFTPGGQPKVDENTLTGLDFPEAKLARDYLTLAKVESRLYSGKKSYLSAVGKDGRIHGRVNSNGAVTGRMTHSNPPLAGTPKVKKGPDGKVLMGLAGGYGWEMRSKFIAPPKKLLVGTDADGLELRMLGHYLAKYDGGAFAHAVVSGDKSKGEDAHSINQRLLKMNSRDNAKTAVYGYLYGAQDHKLGTILYEDFTDAQKARFNARHSPGEKRNQAFRRLGRRARIALEEGLSLGQLQQAVQKAAKRGYLIGLDGRRLRVRSKHAALNTLLQGGGAVVLKKALVLSYDALTAEGWVHGREFAYILNIHDEFQMEVDEDIAKQVAEINAEAIAKAGRYFNLRIPLSGSSDIGPHWAATH